MEQPQEENQEEPKLEVRKYLDIIKHQWLAFSVCFLISVAIGAVISFGMRSVYRAVTEIEISKGFQTPLKGVSKEKTIQGEADAFQREGLRERIKEAFLELSPGIAFKCDETQIDVQKPKGSALTIWVDGPYKDFVKTYAQVMLDVYKKFSADVKAENTDSALAALNIEIERVSIMMDDTQARLAALKKEYPNIALEEYGNYSPQYFRDLANKISSAKSKNLMLERNIELIQESDDPNVWISVIDHTAKEFQPSLLKPSSAGTALKEKEDFSGQTGGAIINFDRDAVNSALAKNKTKRWYSLKTKYGELQAEYARIEALYKPGHPTKVAIEQAIETTTHAMQAQVRLLLEVFKVQQRSLQNKIGMLNRSVGGGLGTQDLSDVTVLIQLKNLKDEVARLKKMYDALMKRINEIKISVGSDLTSITVIEHPRLLRKPVAPDIPRYMLIAILLGLALGYAVAFMLDSMDDSIRSAAVLKTHIGWDCLGVVPTIKWKKKDTHAHRIPFLDNEEVVEAYRTIRTNILLSRPPGNLKIILATSATPAEGKTTTSVNVAIVLAQTGRKVLLVDSDLRRPRVHRFFDIKNKKGFSSILSRQASVEECVLKTDIPGLEILPAGPISSDPTKFLLDPSVKNLFSDLREKYDIVLVDSAPVLTYTDTIILDRYVDGILFVIHGAKTSRIPISRAKEVLADNASKMIGAIIDRLSIEEAYPYCYHPYKSHEHAEDDQPADGSQEETKKDPKQEPKQKP